jgi:hypothetical protein
VKPTVLETDAVVDHENMDHQGTLNISIYFWQKSWAEIDCKRSVIQSVREQKREKEWETRTNLGFEISQVPFYERSCKEYILCTCRKSLPGVHLVNLHASRSATAIVVSYLTYLWFSTSSASSDHLDSPYEHRSDKLQSHTPPPRQISRSATSTSGYLVWDHIAIANQNPAPTQVMKRADKKL